MGINWETVRFMKMMDVLAKRTAEGVIACSTVLKDFEDEAEVLDDREKVGIWTPMNIVIDDVPEDELTDAVRFPVIESMTRDADGGWTCSYFGAEGLKVTFILMRDEDGEDDGDRLEGYIEVAEITESDDEDAEGEVVAIAEDGEWNLVK